MYDSPYSRLNRILFEIRELTLEVQNLNTSFLLSCRPHRNPSNPIPYKIWFDTLTEEQKLAEELLIQRGYYQWEIDMFECKDSEGTQVHTHDTVEYNETKWVITAILEPNKIQIIPVEKGLAKLIEPAEVRVVDSFISRLNNYKTDEELLAILESAKGLIETKKKRAEKKEEEVVGLDIQLDL